MDTALQVRGQMAAAGVEANAWTHHQLVDAGVVSGDVPAMLGALRDLHAAGHTPRLALLERCLARAERAGDRAAVRELLELLLSRDYRVVGVDAKVSVGRCRSLPVRFRRCSACSLLLAARATPMPSAAWPTARPPPPLPPAFTHARCRPAAGRPRAAWRC